MKDRLTQFGIKCREFRARYNLKMGDQAKGLAVSVAYISAIECGKRPVPEDYPDKLCEWLSLPSDEARGLCELASGERKVVRVFPKGQDQALLAEDFSHDLNGLSPEGIRLVREALKSAKADGYSNEQIRKRAYLLRSVFSLGEKLSFDLLRLVENQLRVVDQDFYLQVDPDYLRNGNLHIYSDSNGKTSERFVATEWFYNAAYYESDDSRFKLAHELGHWILHPMKSLAFLRDARTNRSYTRFTREEYEADFFAREFLMPIAAVEMFASHEALAKATKVPSWCAEKRWRDFGMLAQAEREQIKRLASEFEGAVRPALRVESLPSVDEPVQAVHKTEAAILHFPQTAQARVAKRERPATLPLFDYAEAKQSDNDVLRSDQFYADFGWRG
jgi:Zn-dependent peptidase ImmA (M78 family)